MKEEKKNYCYIEAKCLRNEICQVFEYYAKSFATKKFDTMLKEVNEEYITTLINFSKYKLVMFPMAKIMEITKNERNKVALYLFYNVKTYN